MIPPRFTKLTKISHYTDIICVGLSVSVDKYQFSERACYENIHGFHIIHLRPKDGRLYQFGDVLTVDSSDVFDVLIKYINTRHNTLVVVNHSLVCIGSSDFTGCLNTDRIRLCENEIEGNQFGLSDSDDLSTQSFIVSCPPTVISFRDKETNKRYTLVDIANYGCKYMSDIFDNLNNDDKKLVFNDAELGVSEDNSLTCCALIAKFMQKLYSICIEHKLGGLGLTYSSIGMRAFRSRFYQGDILPHADKESRILEDSCYLGGRVEARYHGYYNKKCYLIDIMSLYPHLGRIKTFPTELAYTQDNPNKATVAKWLDNHIVAVHCNLTTDQPAYPKRTDSGLIFPTGTFNTFLIGEEFSDSWNEGRVNHVYRMQAYHHKCILKHYSEHALAIRSRYKASNERLGEFISKVTTNGLWGKLGQSSNIWICQPDEIADRPYGGFNKYSKGESEPSQYRIIDWEVSKLEYAPFMDNTFVPISAAMNSYSRHYLWRHMLQAGLHNVLYCCVDGLIVTQEGYDRLAWLIAPNPYQYGMYKVTEIGEYCNILGHGLYTIGRKIASQGIPKGTGKRYTGFWSAIDDKSTLINKKVQEGQQVVSINYQSEIKQALINPVDKTGTFIAPTYVEQPIDSQILLNPLGTEHRIHQPEWFR